MMLLEELSQHSIQSLRVFAYVAVLGSLTEAAEALKLSQPAVSLQINNLENHLGFPLFKRQGRKNILTSQGQEFLNRLLPQLEKLEQILVDAKTAEHLVRPQIQLGSMQGIAEYWLGEKLIAFKKNNPNLRILLEIGEESALQNLLDTGKLSMIITPSKYEHPRVISRVLTTEYFVPVGNKEQIAHLQKVLHEASQTKKFWRLVNWIGYGDHDMHDPWAQRWLDHNGFAVTKHFDFVHQLNSYSLIKELLKTGEGVCVAPKHVVQKELSNGDLYCLEDAKYLALENKLYISYREKSLNQIHKAFRDSIL